jgi:tryptophan synthase beta chain
LDYVSLGPEHSFLFEEKRIAYKVINDDEALKAFQLCSELEGIIPALEPSHCLGELIKIAPKRKKNEIVILNMCGRGDKDIFMVAKHLGIKL